MFGDYLAGEALYTQGERYTEMTPSEYVDYLLGGGTQSGLETQGGTVITVADAYDVLPAGTVLVKPAETDVFKYQIEVRDEAGTLLAQMPYRSQARHERALNEVGKLTFRYPARKSEAAYLVRPNIIWLRDAQTQLLDKFRILTAKNARDGVETYREVEAESLMSRMNDEWVDYYSATDAKVSTILTAIFAMQQNTHQTWIGLVDWSIGNTLVSITFEGEPLLNCIRTLYEAVGRGNYWVSKNGLFYWSEFLGAQEGHRIAFKENMTGVEATYDYSQLFTRLYLYGEGASHDSKLNLTDAGQPQRYIEANTGTYGVITRIITDRAITDAETLLAIAQTLIGTFSVPLLSYAVRCVELAESTAAEGITAIELGATVIVSDYQLGIDTTARVIRHVRNLDRPLDIEIELSNRNRSIADIIADMLKRLRKLENTENAGVELSDNVPPDVGTGTPGTSDLAARYDHSHGFDSTAFAAEAQTALLGSTTPERVGDANAAGDNTKASREDHIHQYHSLMEFLAVGADDTAVNLLVNVTSEGILSYTDTTPAHVLRVARNNVWTRILNVLTAADGTALQALTNKQQTDIGFGTTDGYLYYYNGSSFVELARIWFRSVASYATLSALSPADGSIGYVEDQDNFYVRANGVWKSVKQFVKTTAPSSIGESVGDIWYDSDDHKGYVYINGAWKLFTHFA